MQHLARLAGPAGGVGVDRLAHPPTPVIIPEADLLVTRPRAERLGLDQPILLDATMNASRSGPRARGRSPLVASRVLRVPCVAQTVRQGRTLPASWPSPWKSVMSHLPAPCDFTCSTNRSASLTLPPQASHDTCSPQTSRMTPFLRARCASSTSFHSSSFTVLRLRSHITIPRGPLAMKKVGLRNTDLARSSANPMGITTRRGAVISQSHTANPTIPSRTTMVPMR